MSEKNPPRLLNAIIAILHFEQHKYADAIISSRCTQEKLEGGFGRVVQHSKGFLQYMVSRATLKSYKKLVITACLSGEAFSNLSIGARIQKKMQRLRSILRPQSKHSKNFLQLLLYYLVKVVAWIWYGSIKTVTWICQRYYVYFLPFAKQNHAEV